MEKTSSKSEYGSSDMAVIRALVVGIRAALASLKKPSKRPITAFTIDGEGKQWVYDGEWKRVY
jgi:hypothetical protein